jgi:hypothetical protein
VIEARGLYGAALGHFLGGNAVSLQERNHLALKGAAFSPWCPATPIAAAALIVYFCHGHALSAGAAQQRGPAFSLPGTGY